MKGMENNIVNVYRRNGADGMERMELNGVHIYEHASVVTPKKVRKRWVDELHYPL